MAKRPYRRRIFLINKRFQIRFAIYVCSFLITVSFIYPVVVYNLFEYFIRYAAVDPNGPALAGLFQARQDLIALMAGTGVAFIALTFMASLFLAHRIAGPLFKLRRYFSFAREGKYRADVYFRKYDYFPELAVEYNQMMGTIRDHFKRIGNQIEVALKDAGPKGKPELEAALQSIHSSLEPPTEG